MLTLSLSFYLTATFSLHIHFLKARTTMSRIMMIKQLTRLSEASKCSLTRALCTSSTTTIPAADLPSLKTACAAASIPSLARAAAARKDSRRGPRVPREFALGEGAEPITLYLEEHIASLCVPQELKDGLLKVLDGLTKLPQNPTMLDDPMLKSIEITALLLAAGWHAADLIVRKLMTMYAEKEKPNDRKDRFDERGMHMQVDFAGYSKEDLKLYVEKGVVYIEGKGTDILGNPDEFNKKVVIPPNFLYDPECGTFDARKGQVKITFPYAKGQCDTQKTGRFPLQPSSDLD